MSSADCGHSWTWPDSPEVREIGLGVAALAYAGWGYAVLPLVPGGKKPHPMLGVSGGVHWASAHPGRVASWWRADPAANIGVACGSISGLCVVDLDLKAGARGPESWQDFLRQYRLELPVSPVVQTPSGGQHGWLRTPPSWAVPERPGILPGVDVKGDGGYVVAPPSGLMVHADGRDGEHGGLVGVPYTWLSGCPCTAPDMPGWMPGWLASAPRAGLRLDGSGAGPDLDQALEHGFARGTRNSSMHRTACSLFRQYGTSDAGMAAVARRCHVIWDASDRTDWPWTEVLTSIESARRFVAGREQSERALWSGPGGDWARRHGS